MIIETVYIQNLQRNTNNVVEISITAKSTQLNIYISIASSFYLEKKKDFVYMYFYHDILYRE